jgi:hypothetical protein
LRVLTPCLLMFFASGAYCTEQTWVHEALNYRLQRLKTIDTAVVRTSIVGYADSDRTDPVHEDTINYFYSGDMVRVEVARVAVGEAKRQVFRDVYYLNSDRRTQFRLLDRVGRTEKRIDKEVSFNFWFSSSLMWPFAQMQYLETGSNVTELLLLDGLPDSIGQFMPRGGNYKYVGKAGGERFSVIFFTGLVEYASAVRIEGSPDGTEGFLLESVDVLGYPAEGEKEDLDRRMHIKVIERQRVAISDAEEYISLPKIADITEFDLFTGNPVNYQRATIESYEINLILDEEVFSPDFTLINRIYDADTGKTAEVEY